MKKLTLLALTLAFVLALTGCGSGKTAASDMKAASAPSAVADNGYYEEPVYEAEYWDEAEWSEEAAPAEDNSYQSDFTEVQAQTNRKLVYTSSYTIETKAFEEAVENVRALVAAAGGYMESSNVEGNSYNYSNSRYAHFTARVPVANYNTMAEKLGNVGNVRSHNETVDDISDSYYDVQAELDSYNLEQERLLAMMEKADKMEDLIALEDKLAQVRYYINDRTSTIKRYDGMVTYSTFNIELTEVKEYEPEEPDTLGMRIVQTFRKSIDFLGRLGEALLIALIFLIPVGIVVGAIVFVIVLLVKSGKKKKAKKKATKMQKMMQQSVPQMQNPDNK